MSTDFPQPYQPPPMSSTQLESLTAASTPTANVADTDSSSDSDDGLTSSSSLYLYTFLATLILLLTISILIIMRSLIIRRRHRRLVQEAIDSGTYVPGVYPPPLNAAAFIGAGRDRLARDIGERPTWWEARVDEKEVVEEKMQEWEGGRWEAVQPLSVAVLTKVLSEFIEPRPPQPPPSVEDHRSAWSQYWRPRPPPLRLPSMSTTPEVPQISFPRPSADELLNPNDNEHTKEAQVTFLIAMPRPSRSGNGRPGSSQGESLPSGDQEDPEDSSGLGARPVSGMSSSTGWTSIDAAKREQEQQRALGQEPKEEEPPPWVEVGVVNVPMASRRMVQSFSASSPHMGTMTSPRL